MPTAEHRSIKIVIVEDDKFMQSILQKYFANSFSVEVFSDGFHVLSYLQEGNIPDLIVTDLNTPNLGGLALIKQIKASDFFSSIPIVVLSGEESSEMIVTCLDAGADDFVVKPFNPKELEARIKVVLRRTGNFL
ncbi:MAG: response regulator transcription factor [Bacteroidetes bacterium]|jgi:DNA-binding response OmpR family regulator|nr:response regulator transcription factor [Bacteroidota bacterium]